MQALPSPFQEALHAQTAFTKKVLVTATRGSTTAEIVPSTGQIVQDSRRSMRWNGSLVIPIGDLDLLPTLPEDLLTPFGTIITIRLGVVLANSAEADLPFGKFMVDGSPVAMTTNSRNVTLTLVDLADRLAKYRFESPFTVAAGVDLAAAVNSVVIDRLGSSPGLSDTGVILVRPRVFGLDPTLDPWRELTDLASGFGYRLWHNRAGALTLDSIPTLDPSSALPFPGPLSVAGGFDHRPPNVFVVRGESSDDTPPIQGVAMDNDPSSPTYAGSSPGSSPYGRVTQFFASPLITTQGQADLAAQNMLVGVAAGAATWVVTRPYDPTLDPDDVYSIAIDEDTDLPLAVDAVTVEIAGITTAQCRAIAQVVP